MNQRISIALGLLCAGELLAFSPDPKTGPTVEAGRPNVILILVDDMGWSDIGCYGSEVATPNLDRLAGDGIRFTQVYNNTKCFPSRASLLTGLYSQRIGYHKSYRQPMDHAMTLGELFQSAGYTTLWSGKHHSTERPTTRGFDLYSGLLDGACNHFNPGRQREGEPKPAQKRKNRSWVIDGELVTPHTPNKGFYTTDAFTDYALDWLDENEPGRPFFLYLAYTAPHDPLMAWPEDIAKYRDVYKVGYETIRRARFAKQKATGLLPEDYPLSEPTHRSWEALDEATREEEALRMAVYAAMIDRLDQNIGRLLAQLEAMGVAENTLILFTSDNGASAEVVNIGESHEIGGMQRWASQEKHWANVSNTPLRYYKNSAHEGGIKTPLLVHWPAGIGKRNRVEATPLHFIDFFPTFADLIDVDHPQRFNDQDLIPLDGISFLPLLKGGSIQREKPLFWQWGNNRAVREDDWKLVSGGGGPWELYDLAQDPVEAHDLAAVQPDKVKRLLALYETWETSHRKTD